MNGAVGSVSSARSEPDLYAPRASQRGAREDFRQDRRYDNVVAVLSKEDGVRDDGRGEERDTEQ